MILRKIFIPCFNMNKGTNRSMTMRVLTWIFCASCLFGCAHANKGDVVSVKGRGVGTDETSALKDAYRDAIETAVGLYVEAEQLIKNDELIKDEILTHSNAYIENYVVKERTVNDGLVKITILAKVKKCALIEKVEGVMSSEIATVRTSLNNAHAQLSTTEKRDEDATALLRKALDGLWPGRMTIDCALALPDPIIAGASGGRPRNMREKLARIGNAAAAPNGYVGADYLFRVGINAQRYFECVVPRLQSTLSRISVVRPKRILITVRSKSPSDIRSSICSARPKTGWSGAYRVGEGFCAVRESLSFATSVSPASRGGFAIPEPYNVLLVTGANRIGNLTAELYQLHGEAFAELQSWFKSVGGLDSYGFLVSFLDGEDEILVQDVLSVNVACCVVETKWHSRESAYTIAPWFMTALPSQAEYFWKRINLPRESLPLVKKIKIEIAN